MLLHWTAEDARTAAALQKRWAAHTPDLIERMECVIMAAHKHINREPHDSLHSIDVLSNNDDRVAKYAKKLAIKW